MHLHALEETILAHVVEAIRVVPAVGGATAPTHRNRGIAAVMNLGVDELHEATAAGDAHDALLAAAIDVHVDEAHVVDVVCGEHGAAVQAVEYPVAELR